MSETAPVPLPLSPPPAPAAKAAAKKPKKAAGGSKARKPAGPSVTELITKAVSASKERKGLSLAALKKALAAGGYDVEKNNSRIKLGLKSLVSKGTLVQTKGIGASGSFRLSKKPGEVKEKAPKKRAAAAKPKKPAAKKAVQCTESEFLIASRIFYRTYQVRGIQIFRKISERRPTFPPQDLRVLKRELVKR
ncbi:PREDICTED: LOW QUALITY PROTEIN: histone H1.01-like [Pygoscelis adeliae]|uniref:LOW QUALITY PROTEIN: histone H1.01-like n=1 Tax=Pygoscelis adeliae TaxID=9238 RepID=UPI0004F4FA78|nr:PREDICTED: LOW QUALITY PROTEIN: histone H1.01-like [Pygoscelis adeliae]